MKRKRSRNDSLSFLFVVVAVALAIGGLLVALWKPLRRSTPVGKLLGLAGVLVVGLAAWAWSDPEGLLPRLSGMMPDDWARPGGTGHLVVVWVIAIAGIILYVKGVFTKATVLPNGAALAASLQSRVPAMVRGIVDSLRQALSDGELDREREAVPILHTISLALAECGLESFGKASAAVLVDLARQAFAESLEEAKRDGVVSAGERGQLEAYAEALPTLFPPQTVQAALLAAEASCAIESGRLPVVQRPGILMRYRGEKCHFVARDVRLAMEKTQSLGYRGGHIGTTVPVAGFPIRFGMHQGKVKTQTALQWTDAGDLYITSKRLVFVGKTSTTTLSLSRVVQVEAPPTQNILAVAVEGAGAKHLFFSTADAPLLAAGVKVIVGGTLDSSEADDE
jgi:hypothetical protein